MGETRIRLRADIFLSRVPYDHMMADLGMITYIPNTRGGGGGGGDAAEVEMMVRGGGGGG